jgi:hypothetical protein
VTILEDVSFTFEKIEVQDLGTGAMATDGTRQSSDVINAGRT